MISPSVFLTAAHCGRRQGENIIVGALYSSDKKNINQADAVKRKCVEYIEDPTFDFVGNNNNPDGREPPYNNDFALCRLDKPVTTLQTIAINENPNWPPLKTNGSPTQLTTIGLGTLTSGGNTPSQLQTVQVPIVSNKVCEKNYGKNEIFTPGNICAGAKNKDYGQGASS